MVKTSASNVGGVGSIPGWGAKIPHALWPKKPKNIKQKQYCNKFNKDLKNGLHQNKILKKKKREKMPWNKQSSVKGTELHGGVKSVG